MSVETYRSQHPIDVAYFAAGQDFQRGDFVRFDGKMLAMPNRGKRKRRAWGTRAVGCSAADAEGFAAVDAKFGDFVPVVLGNWLEVLIDGEWVPWEKIREVK